MPQKYFTGTFIIAALVPAVQISKPAELFLPSTKLALLSFE